MIPANRHNPFAAGITDPGYNYGPKSIVSPEPVIVTDILEYVHVAPDRVPTT
jgi:hypothetical protein